jgi:hypothetical protein
MKWLGARLLEVIIAPFAVLGLAILLLVFLFLILAFVFLIFGFALVCIAFFLIAIPIAPFVALYHHCTTGTTFYEQAMAKKEEKAKVSRATQDTEIWPVTRINKSS